MRIWVVIWCLLFAALELQAQDIVPYPYHKPDDLNPIDYQRLNEDSNPEPFSCQDNFTGFFKMGFNSTEEVLEAEDTTLIFRTDQVEWTELDEKGLEQKFNQQDLALLKFIYKENVLATNEFLEDLQQYISDYLTAWEKNMCDNECDKVGDECDTKVWLHWIDTSNFRCEYRTRLSFLDEGSDSNTVNQVFHPALVFDGAFYFKLSCACKLADDAISLIEPPWNEIQLTGTIMKANIPAPVPIMKEKMPMPWWIPVSGWAAAGGVTTYLLTQKKKKDAKQVTLNAVNDSEIMECEATGILMDVLMNDQGNDLTLLSVDNIIGGEVSIQQNSVFVSNPSDKLIQFNYTVGDNSGNFSSAEVIVLVNSNNLVAVDDQYETSKLTVEGNLLDNDQGSNIQLVHYEPPPDGNLVISADGQFSYTPANRDGGQIQFLYVVGDKCNNLDSAMCLIDVKLPPCDIVSSFETTPAQCGRANGSASISITPQEDYQFAWSDGNALAMRSDLAAGIYDVVIASEFCGDTISIEIGEKPPQYNLQATGIPGNCTVGGDVHLTFDHSLDGDLTIAVTSPSGINEYATSSETGVSLSEYTKVLPGLYTVEVWNALSGKSCSQTIQVQVPDNSPELVVSNDTYSTSFMTAIDINVLSNDLGLSLVLTNINEIIGGSVVSSEDGQVVFTPEEGFSGEASFQYRVMDGCGRVEEAQVTILVEAPDCDLTVDISVQMANCGREDGSAIITLSPERDYQFSWPDGNKLSERADLAAGIYEVVITSEYCEDTVLVNINENPTDYNLQGVGVPGDCVTGGDVELTFDHSLDGELSIDIAGPSGTDEYSTTETTGISLSSFITVLPGNYTIEIWNALSGRSCSQTVEVLVPDNSTEVMAKDDDYNTEYMTPKEFNVLTNDIGDGLALTGVNAISGGQVEYSEDGNVVFTPEDGFAGEASFQYVVTDICGREMTAMVTIEVGPLDCTMTAGFVTERASCGRSDGSASISVTPAGNYQYIWSDGSLGSGIINKAPGRYSVEVRREGTPCQKTFEVVIGEKATDYIQAVQANPINCASSGNITLSLNVPPGEQLVVEVIHPEGTYVLTTKSSQISLSNHVPIVAGEYLIKVNDEVTGGKCQDESTVFIEDNRNYPKVELIEKSPPSSPSSSDGSVSGQIIGQTFAPYRIFLNGQVEAIIFGGEFTINEMGYGEHTIYIVDINECKSNSVVVNFTPTGTIQFHLESGYVTSLLPTEQNEVPDDYDRYVHLSTRLKGVYHYRNHFTALSAGFGMAGQVEDRILERYETTFSQGVRKKWLGQTIDVNGGLVWSFVNNLQRFDEENQQYGVFLGSTIHRNKSTNPSGLFRLNFEGYLYLSKPIYPEIRCNIGF